MPKSITASKAPEKLVIFCFVILSVWWFISYFILKDYNNLLWGASYQIVAILGGVFGLIVSKHWGGFKSLLGKSIMFLSIGLLFQAFGQTVFSYYNLFLKVSIPYPSIADIGFFGSIPFYIYGTLLLSRISGSSISLKSYSGKALAIFLPIGMLSLSYYFFLQNYEFDWTNPLTTFLDFGYPFGQAFYISFAILTYILSKKFLGGIMKGCVLLILMALAIQYAADYNFLFQAYNETWINGGYGDYIYLLAYFIMSLSLIKLGSTFNKIRES